MRFRLVVALAVAGAALAVSGPAVAAHPAAPPDFGPNVKIFDPSMTTAQIKSQLDAIAAQQQYLVRNSDIDGWTNGVWNQVFAGVVGAPPQTFPNPPYTTLATNPASREKPFLYVDASKHYNVFVPDAQFGTTGTTWALG